MNNSMDAGTKQKMTSSGHSEDTAIMEWIRTIPKAQKSWCSDMDIYLTLQRNHAYFTEVQ